MAPLPSSRHFLIALWAGLTGTSVALAQLPTNSSVDFAHQTGPAFMTLTVNDPSNSRWTLQFSRDMSTWTNLRNIDVVNGHFRVPLHRLEGEPHVFYRAKFDSADQGDRPSAAQALNLPVQAHNYANQPLPPHFLANVIVNQDNTPTNNPITDAGATLGRVLFYDKRLSANNTVSCASCHQQEHGFSDPRQFSVGFAGGKTDRNSMGLTNARYYQRGRFFWDERAATLEEQVLLPIQNEVEMGVTLEQLVAKVSAEPYYAELFEGAFGDSTITTDRIARALAQFVRSIISTETKFDAGRSSNFANFTPQESLGRNLFNGRARCASCHGTDNFVPNNVFNNGLENPYSDQGIGAITARPQDNGKFKVPSLRNIGLTAPYMHDGRFATLEEVVEFYNSQVVDHPNLAPQLRGGGPGGPGGPGGGPGGGAPLRLNLNDNEKEALVAFMNTLTDPDLSRDPKFSDPFRYGGEEEEE